VDIVVRATVIFSFVWLVTRGVGKRPLSEMSAFEMILLVTIGDLVQQGVTQDDRSVVGAMLAVGTIAFWVIVFTWVSWRIRTARQVIDGVPVVVVRDGQPIDAMLARERLPLEELLEGARNNGIKDLSDVEVAILESDGKLSFIQRSGGGTQNPDASEPPKSAR
jgi:uncharacterized membrane protein YcaP (DUF421 family)